MTYKVNQDTHTFWRWRVFDADGMCINFNYVTSEQEAIDAATTYIEERKSR